VLHRVEELADRPAGHRPEGRPEVTYLIQLHQVLGEIQRVGPKAKSVEAAASRLVAALGSELDILTRLPLDEVTRAGGELFGEAVARLRRGQVSRQPGYDGEYGVIRLFEPAELGASTHEALFEVEPGPRPERAPARAPRPRGPRDKQPPPPPLAAPPSPHRPWEPMLAGMEEVGTGLLDRLDALQRVAASASKGPLLVVAGPGTGKTRTLTHRIAYLCLELGVPAEQCLAITFTRRAAEEMRGRLEVLLPEGASRVFVSTFHALCLSLLREHPEAAGLSDGFAIADDSAQAAAISTAGDDLTAYAKLLREQNLVDLDELGPLTVAMLRDDPTLAGQLRTRWPWVFVDEYQDIDATQYELLRLLTRPDGNVYAIGDPDQAIYSFRGADVGYFLRFREDFTNARVVRLTRNYRSSAPIIATASQVIAPTSLVRGRRLDPARLDPDAPLVGLHTAASPAAEAEWVTATVDELVGGLSHRSFDSGRVDSRAGIREALSFADIAVLYRTDAQAGAVVEALTRAGIPVQKRSHDRLRSRRAVAEIARELKFAPSADMSLVERVRAAASALAAGRPRLFEVDGSAPALLTPAEVYSAADVLLPLAARCGDDLEALLQALATGAEVDALDPRAQAVTLLTLHAAKGLEWPVVFLIGCEDDLLPLRLPGQPVDESAVAEERRLFFVGLTRAQSRLFISHASQRTRHGATRQPARTPFLDPVDPGLLERVGTVDDGPTTPRHRQLRLL
jgi:superfamily I DNA/RNA helicase